MNQLNYASLEASRRLVGAGIVLKTEAVWIQNPSDTIWRLFVDVDGVFRQRNRIPAPSMAEVWRELPVVIAREGIFFSLTAERDGIDESTIVAYVKPGDDSTLMYERNVNPTDALIDLLIWVRKEPTP